MSALVRSGVVFGGKRRIGGAILAAALALTAAGCITQEYQQGYILQESALAQVKPGSSREQVLVVMGTPSTVATLNGEVFYYISQKTERKVAFLKKSEVDRNVVAVYFDKNQKVERVANYGIQDGKIFDFISRETVAAGQDYNLLRNLLGGLVFGNPVQ